MSLELVKCGMCGKATVVGEGHKHVCDACRDDEHKLYSRVRALIREYNGSRLTIQDVAEILKVDEKKISHLVDSGYFKLVMREIRSFD